MSTDALAILQTVFGSVWLLFTSWHLPGTRMTPAEFAFFLLAAGLTLRFFRRLGKVDDSEKGGKD